MIIFYYKKSKPIWVRINAKNNENFEIDKKIQKKFKLLFLPIFYVKLM